MAKHQKHGISFMTLTGMKFSHGPTNGSGSTNGKVTGNLFTLKAKTKILFPDMQYPSTDIGKAAHSLWNILITGQTHPWQSKILAVQPNGNTLPQLSTSLHSQAYMLLAP
jgi:hypothetical protein